ncbi:MAG: insulinase family protein [Cyclobacteriaceae bacterium]|nr:insulinase family protein [Cyclobacteriaceae bacterium]
MLDRSVAPKISFNFEIQPLKYQTHILGNSIPVYSISDEHQEVIGLQVVFSGGKSSESVNGASYFATHLLKSGTKEYNSNYINEFFEFRGAFVQVQSGLDSSSFSLYCLSEKLKEVLPFFLALFNQCDFPEDQIDKLKKKKNQEININLQKSSYWANKLLKQSLFGKHVYGHLLSIEDVEVLERKHILNFWEGALRNINFVTIAGKFDIEFVLRLLENSLEVPVSTTRTTPELKTRASKQTKKLELSEQTSLKIGLPTIDLNHPDYPLLSLGNTIWGGYFGSRLMQTIREEKGLTYGIRSSFSHLQEASYLQISADLKKGAGEETISLIESELNLLINQSVNPEELNKVKSFIIGEYKSGTESIFDKISKVKFLKVHGLTDDYFIQLYNKILAADSKRIKASVEKYIKPQLFHTVIVE